MFGTATSASATRTTGGSANQMQMVVRGVTIWSILNRNGHICHSIVFESSSVWRAVLGLVAQTDPQGRLPTTAVWTRELVPHLLSGL